MCKKNIIKGLCVSLFSCLSSITMASTVMTYPAPKSEKPSIDYQIKVDDKDVFCYIGEVYDARFPEGKHFGKMGIPYSTVSFGYFDFEGKVKVSVKVNHEVKSVTVRPLSRDITPQIKDDNIVEFYVDKPGSLTIETNNCENRALHLFCNPLQKDKPVVSDSNVIYYGPGEHVVNSIKLKSNQTLFVDGGAVLYFDVFEGDSVYNVAKANNVIPLKNFGRGIEAVKAKNIKIKGRGILDFTRISEKYGRKRPINFTSCENAEIEGIIIRGANCWHATMYRSNNILIDNMKEISYGFNSDGIDIVLCHNVHIKNCFLRQRDDGIIMKSHEMSNEILDKEDITSNVLVENCVLWSDWGYALGVTYEVRRPIKNICFRNCDIINATHISQGQGVIGVLVSDSSSVSDIRFENITIERSLKPLIKLEQKITKWTKNKKLGKISNVSFKNINYLEGEKMPIILSGYSNTATISHVSFDNLFFLKNQITSKSDWPFIINEYVFDVLLNKNLQISEK